MWIGIAGTEGGSATRLGRLYQQAVRPAPPRAGKINLNMPHYCLARIERTLNDGAKPLKTTRIAILGVSYKPGVGDIRESPALRIIELLRERGADIGYHDPHVPSLSAEDLVSREFDELVGWAELAVIATAHPSVDHGAVVDRVPLLVDLRGHTRRLGAANRAQL